MGPVIDRVFKDPKKLEESRQTSLCGTRSRGCALRGRCARPRWICKPACMSTTHGSLSCMVAQTQLPIRTLAKNFTTVHLPRTRPSASMMASSTRSSQSQMVATNLFATTWSAGSSNAAQPHHHQPPPPPPPQQQQQQPQPQPWPQPQKRVWGSKHRSNVHPLRLLFKCSFAYLFVFPAALLCYRYV